MRHSVEISRFVGSYEINIDDVNEVTVKNYTPDVQLTVMLSYEKAEALRDELIEMCGMPKDLTGCWDPDHD